MADIIGIEGFEDIIKGDSWNDTYARFVFNMKSRASGIVHSVPADWSVAKMQEVYKNGTYEGDGERFIANAFDALGIDYPEEKFINAQRYIHEKDEVEFRVHFKKEGEDRVDLSFLKAAQIEKRLKNDDLTSHSRKTLEEGLRLSVRKF